MNKLIKPHYAMAVNSRTPVSRNTHIHRGHIQEMAYSSNVTEMSSGTLYRVALVETDVSENLSSPSSGFLKQIGFHNCITVGTPSLCLSIERYN
jgi:hypothetical protein